MNAPLEADRLVRLLEDAVGSVRPRADALESIRRGARRRRAAHRAAAVAAVFAIFAGGAIAYAAVHRGTPLPTGPASGSTPRHSPSASPTAPAGKSARAHDWDIDGDGRPDSARIIPLGKGDRNTRFQLVVNMSSLGTQRIPFTAASAIKAPPNGPQIVGSVDADADGRAEIFIMIDSGAATQFWTIFKLVNHRITQVTIAGQPASLSVGGSVMDDSGFSCGRPSGDLVIYGYGALSYGARSQKWSLTRDTYRWVGSRLVLVAKRSRTIRASSRSPRLAKYAGVRCGNLPQYAPR
jgi:hypothetical protein